LVPEDKQTNFIPLMRHQQAPDQGSMVDFFLFPRLKCITKGARFADVAAVHERVTAVLRSIPKESFADSFQKLYERCQQCVVRMAIILKANKVNLFVSSVLFAFLVPFTELFKHTMYKLEWCSLYSN
jgi:hypothetical protein